MSNTYKLLPFGTIHFERYKLSPVRFEDRYSIMQWRNEQIDILRQKTPLTKEEQDRYFSTVVKSLFEDEKPNQFLFSIFESDILIGYGGLVHIDWVSRNGEISFITATERTLDENQFIADWKSFLRLLKTIVSSYLGFVKIYTFAYDVRPPLFKALIQSSFKEEARLVQHISIQNQLFDVLIHSYFFEAITFRMAVAEDVSLFFEWVNDVTVRKNSFGTQLIQPEEHASWFASKLLSERSLLLVALIKGQAVGQIRFDESEVGVFEIDFSIDASHRGKGLSSEILSRGTAVLALTKPDARRVIGKVKRENSRSKGAFFKAGYKLLQSGGPSEIDMFHFDLSQI